jgi:hypothetical protein
MAKQPKNTGKNVEVSSNGTIGKVGDSLMVSPSVLFANTVYTGRMQQRDKKAIAMITLAFLEGRTEQMGPILVKASGEILDGHTRWEAACEAVKVGYGYSVNTGEKDEKGKAIVDAVSIPANPNLQVLVKILPDDTDVIALQQELNAAQREAKFKDKLHLIHQMSRQKISADAIGQKVGVSRVYANMAIRLKDEKPETLAMLSNSWLSIKELGAAIFGEVAEGEKKATRRFTPTQILSHLQFIAESTDGEGKSNSGAAWKGWVANGFSLTDGNPDTIAAEKETIATVRKKLLESSERTQHELAYLLKNPSMKGFDSLFAGETVEMDSDAEAVYEKASKTAKE